MRTEGTYRLKLTLFEVIGANVHHCKSIFSAPFYVYTAKKFPGMEGVCVLLFSFRFEFLSLSLSLSVSVLVPLLFRSPSISCGMRVQI